MTKVYIVTAGEYSDYHINAVFSTKQLAEAYVVWQNGPNDKYKPSYGSDCHIDEYELDTEAPKQSGAYKVCDYVETIFSGDHINVLWDPKADANNNANVQKASYGNSVFITAFGLTPEHALRSARELARAIKAGTVVI